MAWTLHAAESGSIAELSMLLDFGMSPNVTRLEELPCRLGETPKSQSNHVRRKQLNQCL